MSALSCGVDEGDMRAALRKSNVSFARQLATPLCQGAAKMSLREISDLFGRDRTTVSRACHAIEDWRECPTFDRQIDFLENEFRSRSRALLAEAARSGPPPERKSVRLVS